MTEIRIGFVSPADPRDRWSWSGTTYYMFRALLRQGFSVAPLGRALHTSSRARRAWRWICRSRPPTLPDDELGRARRWAAVLGDELSAGHYDVLFAAVASQGIAFLETTVPIAYLSDATFRALRGYYADATALPEAVARARDELEARAISAARLLVYPSRWAAESAVRDYGARPENVRVVPLGANLDVLPERATLDRRSWGGVCRLLFIGRDWQRKGGDVAVATAAALNRLGIPTELTLCGSTPPHGTLPAFVRDAGALDKKKRRDRTVLTALLEAAHFLILPTRADCYSMVACEANAFGVPVLATATGGLPSLVENGCNGWLLPCDAAGEDYARLIAFAYRDERRYRDLVRSTQAVSAARLNWDAWGRTVGDELRRLAHGAAAARQGSVA